ncbi:hypothetical protein A4U64_26640 (plasmid) [Rhodococcus sp. WB1]|nr:hypothetical protein A4U64_26640 [Rhodococcus sp. WB1]
MFVLLHYYFNAEKHDSDGIWFSPQSFNDRHGLSETTRNRGLEQLVELGAVHMQEKFVDTAVAGAGYRTFRRRIFRLDPRFYPPRPLSAP